MSFTTGYLMGAFTMWLCMAILHNPPDEFPPTGTPTQENPHG